MLNFRIRKIGFFILLGVLFSACKSNSAEEEKNENTSKGSSQSNSYSVANFLHDYTEIGLLLAEDKVPETISYAKGIHINALSKDMQKLNSEILLRQKIKEGKAKSYSDYINGLKTAKNLNELREHYLQLSYSVSKWGMENLDENYQLVFCNMKQAGWFQKKGKIMNPFHGLEMQQCGNVVER